MIPPQDLASYVKITETLGIRVEGEEQTNVISIKSSTPVVLKTSETPEHITVNAIILGIILCVSVIFVYKSVIRK